MRMNLYNDVCGVEGEPTELALFLAFHVDAMTKLKERRDAEDFREYIARVLNKIDEGGKEE